MPLDASADITRRAWVSCPRCADGHDCRVCAAGRTCADHWRFLLEADGRKMFVQCPACMHRWWHDTQFGTGSRRRTTEDVPPGREAA